MALLPTSRAIPSTAFGSARVHFKHQDTWSSEAEKIISQPQTVCLEPTKRHDNMKQATKEVIFADD